VTALFVGAKDKSIQKNAEEGKTLLLIGSK